jgi:competence CoiA-like predicted nuclease
MKSKILNQLIPEIESKSESFAHKAIKNLFYHKILENDPNIIEASLEKYFETRRADVYFKFKSGEEVAVEIQNSPITSKEITARTKDYSNRGIHVLWVFYGDGKCLGSPKSAIHLKNMKISPAEIRLHQLYRGRVYYVNITYENEQFKTTSPYALHFSFSDKYSPKLFKKGFNSFFIRNVNYSSISSWRLLCTTYGNYKIARFYDKNVKYSLVESLRRFTIRNTDFRHGSYSKTRKTKKFLKLVYHIFGDDYGKRIIIESMLRVLNQKKNALNEKYLLRVKKKLSSKVKTKLKQYQG